ncbi:hypothetical protein XMD530_000019 [Marinobacterium sp. xm-d-530]|nr:hypothetical protein [Marinobacterium sp. xm-d-530]
MNAIYVWLHNCPSLSKIEYFLSTQQSVKISLLNFVVESLTLVNQKLRISRQGRTINWCILNITLSSDWYYLKYLLGLSFHNKQEHMDMLALTIKDGETLYIGDDIKIVINKVKGSETKLAVEAPKSVKVLRGSLKD